MWRLVLLITISAVLCCIFFGDTAEEKATAAEPDKVDPAAWGSDHVGKSIPEYVTGDECLFCHRQIGPAWPENRHQLTIRPAVDDDPAIQALQTQKLVDSDSFRNETRFVMGHSRVTRFIKRADAYGKLELLSAKYLSAAEGKPEQPASGQLTDTDDVRWDSDTFGDRCAGCHTTAVDIETRAFSALSLDCFVCHGSVDLAHTKDPNAVLLSTTNQEARVVVSICGQCHLRGGKSKSSGLPYPNTFVAGDNLFSDFAVDLSDEAIGKLAPIEQHIFENVRDVAVLNRTATTCVSCHSVHGQSTEQHQQLGESTACAICHIPNSDNTELRDTYLQSRGAAAHSRVCDY